MDMDAIGEMDAFEKDLQEVESIFVPGCPNISTQSGDQPIMGEIFVADLPNITEMHKRNEEEGTADNAMDEPCMLPSSCENSIDIAQLYTAFNHDGNSSSNPSIEPEENSNDAQSTKRSNEPNNKKVAKKRVRKKPLRKCDTITLEPKYVCNICTKVFQRNQNYTHHMRKEHQIVKAPYACPNCPRKYKYEYELTRHMKKYKPLKERLIFACTQCVRKFQTRVHLNRHIQDVHEDKRSFVCDECGQAVRTSTKLKEHMLIHTDHSPFKCMECGKSFKQKERLKRHMATHGAKYACGQCGKNLSTRFNLIQHLSVHDATKLYKCDLCGSGFRLMSTLKVHLNTHTGHKVYECEFCDKIFAASFSRLKHTRKMHPEQLAELEALSAAKGMAAALNIYDTLTYNPDNLNSMRQNVIFNQLPQNTREDYNIEDFEMHHNPNDFSPNISQQPVSRTLYNINSTVF